MSDNTRRGRTVHQLKRSKPQAGARRRPVCGDVSKPVNRCDAILCVTRFRTQAVTPGHATANDAFKDRAEPFEHRRQCINKLFARREKQ
jgi:hypothetical protein